MGGENMRIYPECIPCLLKRVLYATNLVDPSLGHKAMRTAIDVMHDHYRPGMVSVDLATRVHHAVYRAIGSEDPYREMKRKSNEIARSLMPVVEEYLKGGEDEIERLRRHILVAVIGNVLDFGISGAASNPEELKERINEYINEGLGWDDTPEIHEILSSGGKVVYLCDNAGEIVFDFQLVKYLGDHYGLDVIYVVKDGPILSDATMEDAKFAGIDRIATVKTTGSRYVGIDLNAIGDGLRRDIDDSALIIAKGMANFEALSDTDIGPIAFLMRTKCHPVSESIQAPYNRNIAKLWHWRD
jgi:uncharacterized protein with ATP-grasp and redox domains